MRILLVNLVLALSLLSSATFADTLELADGTLLEGDFVGSSNGIIMVDDQLYEIATSGLQAQTQNEAGRSVARTARAAAIGGLIDGRSGARTGAKVGAGASILTSGSSINVPAGTIVETNLRLALTVPTP
ncbi:MAG: hypothetical protein AAGI11_16645 [Pseudomonadota bacterium]